MAGSTIFCTDDLEARCRAICDVDAPYCEAIIALEALILPGYNFIIKQTNFLLWNVYQPVATASLWISIYMTRLADML